MYLTGIFNIKLCHQVQSNTHTYLKKQTRGHGRFKYKVLLSVLVTFNYLYQAANIQRLYKNIFKLRYSID